MINKEEENSAPSSLAVLALLKSSLKSADLTLKMHREQEDPLFIE